MTGILNPFALATGGAPPSSGSQPVFTTPDAVIPASVAIGDQLLLLVYTGSRNQGDTGAPTATGWEPLGHWTGAGGSGDFFALTVFKRTAQSGDAGATVSPSYVAGSDWKYAAVVGYSGVASVGIPTHTMSSPTSVTTQTAVDNTRLVYFAASWRFNGGAALTLTDPVGVTNRVTGDVGDTHAALRVSDEVQAVAGVTTARTWTGNGAGTETFGVIAIPLLPTAPVSPFATTLVEAHFTAADGTLTAGYTPEIGPHWTNLNGIWTIQGNRLAPPGINEALMCWASLGVTTYSMQFTYSSLSGDPGPIVRVVNSNQYVLCQMNSTGTSGIYRYSAGYTALITPVSVPWADGDTVRVNVTPTTIQVYRNGSLVMSVSNTDFAAADQAGFRVAPAISTVRFDDVYIGY